MKFRLYILVILLFSATVQGMAQVSSLSNIEFVENKGQWDPSVQFRGDIGSGAFFLHRNGFTVLLHNPQELEALIESHGRPAAGLTSRSGTIKSEPIGSPATGGSTGGGAGVGAAMPLHSHAYRVSFLGGSANDQVEVIPDKPLPSYNNYFIGDDPSKWAGHCQIYQGITYKNIYPNIDIRYYSDKGQLKYDIIVHPGGDPGQIALKYEGVDKLSLQKKDLLVHTSVGQVKELSPSSFQFDETGRTAISSKYIIKDGNVLQFKIGEHAPGATVIIDPTLIFCSFTGSKANNWGFTATPGPDGGFYAGGILFSEGFPTTTGAIEPDFTGGIDVGIMKFNTNGSTRLYATYLGGEADETPHSMICDPQGNLVVLGRTYSAHFPFKTKVGPGGGSDIFVAKLDPTGSHLIGCMRIGGSGNDCVNINDQRKNGPESAESLIRNYGDDSRSEVVLDGNNNILIAASSQSPTDFPVTPGVFQPAFGGGSQDGVVLKIDPNDDALIWASYLGGSGDDAAFVLKSSPLTGDIYVAGATSSTNFPGNMSGVIQNSFSGGVCDGYLSIISADGATLKKTTYLGTPQNDAIYGVEIDRKGFPYIMGTTTGSWPWINATYHDAGSKQFVSKLQPDLSAYIYSTEFGSQSQKPNISPVAFLVDRCENVYVSGWGGWIQQAPDPYGLTGTLGMRTTKDAIKASTDNRDFYFIVLKKNMTDILYGTFYGQDDNSGTISEHVDGGTSRYDQNGVIYQAICANCNGGTARPFPTTPNVWSATNQALPEHGCNLAALKIAFNFAGVSAGIRVSVNGRNGDSSGCVPLDAVFQDTLRSAKSYIWSFGDGSADTATTSPAVAHTYSNIGEYLLRVIAIDTNSCNGRDTTYRHVIGRNDKAVLDFIDMKVGPCQSLTYAFMNQSTPPPGKPFGDSSFAWIFGDLPAGSNEIPGGPPTHSISHSFASAGTYIVSLVMIDTNYCNYPDTLSKTLRISPLVKAQFETPATGCAPYTMVINNTTLGGLQFNWDFGDGTTSTDVNPTHVYADTGTYTIRMVAQDSTSCNKIDSTKQTIRVNGKPLAAFTFGPDPPVANSPIIFTNGATGGIKYEWLFGDGVSETKTSLDTAMHLYNRTDTFAACLVVFNQYGCTDTVCHPVPTLINPLLDVPNAFTPGRFGENSTIRVFGFGITHMVFRIYNRWGQVVFQANDPSQGWDGTFKGVLQPMDVYTYTVEAEFFNGKRVQKKGDITLLR